MPSSWSLQTSWCSGGASLFCFRVAYYEDERPRHTRYFLCKRDMGLVPRMCSAYDLANLLGSVLGVTTLRQVCDFQHSFTDRFWQSGVLAAMLVTADFNVAVDFWIHFLLLVLPRREKGQTSTKESPSSFLQTPRVLRTALCENCCESKVCRQKASIT